MIRGIERALTRARHPSKKQDKHPSPSVPGPQPSTDALAQAPAGRRVAILPPSAFGVEPPQTVHIDLTEMTKKADYAWSEADYDGACRAYEALAKRFPTRKLPVVKLMVAYDADVMKETQAFKTASERLASLVPNPKDQALAFLDLFGDRTSQPSAELLGLSLARALALGKARLLGRRPLLTLLQHERCAGMPLLCYAVDRGDANDLAAVLTLIGRLGPAPEIAEQKAVALTMAEGYISTATIEAMLRGGVLPSTAEHLDRLVDKALSSPVSALLEVLFDTCLTSAHTRIVQGVSHNLAQLALLSGGHDYALEKKIQVLATKQALQVPVPGGDSIIGMAISRGGRILASVLDNGFELEGRDPRSGNTPLIEAAARGAIASVGVLLGRGASLTAVNEAGLNALDMARMRGFSEAEQQMRQFPAQQSFDKLLTLLWGDDMYGSMASVRTDLYALDGKHAEDLLAYLPPLLGLGSLPEDFAVAAPWTLKSMRAKRLPAVQWAEKQEVHWRYLARKMVACAHQLTPMAWQGLTDLLEGLSLSWSVDVVRCLFDDDGSSPEHWKAIASSISGTAYQKLKPGLRTSVIRTAVTVRVRSGSIGSAALDWLNAVPVRGFDSKAYWSVMWDFVLCAKAKGDCAALANFVKDDAKEKNAVGLPRTLGERVQRIENFAQSLHPQTAEQTHADQARTQHVNDKRASAPQVLARTHEAVVATSMTATPWIAHASMQCHPAIALCLNYFGSASEMETAGDAGTQQSILAMLYVIFGRAQAHALLGSHDAGSQVRKLILRWHPDKVDSQRAKVAADMTTLLLSLREVLNGSPLRTKLIAFLDARHPQGSWRETHA